MMNNVIHGGAAPKFTKRVFYSGTGTCAVGKALMYNWDAVTVTAENDTLGGRFATISAADWTDARQVMVEDPNYANALHFAGVVSRASDGVVGPNWIEIHCPGSTCEVYTGAAVSVGFSGTGGNQGSTRTFTVAGTTLAATMGDENGQFNYTGLLGEGTAVLLAEGSASVPGDSYLKMARLLSGPPSGGVFTYTLTSVNATQTSIPMHGVIQLANGTLTVESTGGTISVPQGDFIGQEIIVRGPLTAVSNIVTVSFLTATMAISSLETKTGATPALFTTAAVSVTENFVHAKWLGNVWRVEHFGGAVA